MSSAYFASLVTLPTIITEPGSYRTRCGEIVTIHAVSTRHYFECEGVYPNGMREEWHKTGRLYATSPCKNDIVAATKESV